MWWINQATRTKSRFIERVKHDDRNADAIGAGKLSGITPIHAELTTQEGLTC